MAFERLDFSGVRAGNKAIAEGIARDAEAMAKAKQARDRGLEKGIGTVIGFMFGGAAGASAGSKIADMAGGKTDASSTFAGGLESGKEARSAVPFGGSEEKEVPTWLNDPATGGQLNDPMQVASANNQVTEPGLMDRLKKLYNNGIF